MRISSLAQGSILALTFSLLACSRSAPPPTQPVVAQPVRGAPLPPGWAWPPSAGQLATTTSQPGIVRPVDAARLRSNRTSNGCRPMEVLPGFFVMAPCAPLPSMFNGKGVHRQRTQVALPPQIDLRSTGHDGPVKDQQQVGVCWSFAISSVMDNALRRAGKGDVVAPMHVLAAGTWDKLFQTGQSDRALTLEHVFPYDPVKACKLNEEPSEVWCEDAYHVKPGSWRQDPMLAAEVERANAAGAWRITKMETLNNPQDPEEYAEILATGRSIYGAFYIDDAAWGRAQGGIIGDYPVGTRGAHAVTVVGYRIGRGRELLLHNSWGPKWGEGGYAWISEAMVRKHGKDAFVLEVNVGVPGLPGGLPGGGQLPGLGQIPGLNQIPGLSQLPGLGGSTPLTLPFPIPGLQQPSPQPQPGQGASCPVRDLVFGSCAAACPSGSPPVAGICAPSSPGAPVAQQCAAGQVLDWTSQTCVAQCPSGLPPVGGRCFP